MKLTSVYSTIDNLPQAAQYELRGSSLVDRDTKHGQPDLNSKTLDMHKNSFLMQRIVEKNDETWCMK